MAAWAITWQEKHVTVGQAPGRMLCAPDLLNLHNHPRSCYHSHFRDKKKLRTREAKGCTGITDIGPELGKRGKWFRAILRDGRAEVQVWGRPRGFLGWRK